MRRFFLFEGDPARVEALRLKYSLRIKNVFGKIYVIGESNFSKVADVLFKTDRPLLRFLLVIRNILPRISQNTLKNINALAALKQKPFDLFF